ncbi:MAG: hypothetical protein HC800_11460 [Phormidesmis sp. RL_2_1]|nr:hypothetical protein [Phormidesmis sp. RL_2_1]
MRLPVSFYLWCTRIWLARIWHRGMALWNGIVEWHRGMALWNGIVE